MALYTQLTLDIDPISASTLREHLPERACVSRGTDQRRKFPWTDGGFSAVENRFAEMVNEGILDK